MRRRRVLALVTLPMVVVAGSLAATAAVDLRNHDATASDVRSFVATLDADQRDGVPATALAPLRSQARALVDGSAGWSPAWFHSDAGSRLDALRAELAATVASTLAAERGQAAAILTQTRQTIADQTTWLSPAQRASTDGWPAQLDTATTPGALAHLVAQWRADQAALSTDAQSRHDQIEAAAVATAAATAEAPQVPAAVESLIARATPLVSTAHAANLDSGAVETLLGQLRGELAAAAPTAGTVQALSSAVVVLQQTITLNNQTGGVITGLLNPVDQALAESTPSSGGFSGRLATVRADYRAAQTMAQLQAVQQEATALQAQAAAELAADVCGHAVPSGKVITVNLTLQEAVFYQDGCAVNATPVTTGRPQLPTPSGVFHVFFKTTPFTMISPWPRSSPYWYVPSPVSWVMEFNQGGYFLHDAPWEPLSAYGPGSENSGSASHGCIHIPTAVMSWAYTWTPNGTPVLITA